MFLRNRWYVAAQSDELGERPLGRSVLDEPIVLYRDSTGNAIALEDRCVHRQAPLSLGEVVGDTLQCPYHGLRFDQAGTCVAVPGQSTVPPGARVRRYPVREGFGFVHVWMGHPDKADGVEPYKFPWQDNADWRVLHAKFHAGFDHRLLIDNLMDVTHLPYAHKTTIGTAAVAENATSKTERDGERVRVTRWMENIDQAPAHLEVTGYDGKVDRWQVMEFCPPGFVWFQTGSAVAGTGGRDAEGDNLLLNRHSVHALTPETEDSSHYFWATGHLAGSLSAEQERTLYDRSVQAFNEDLVIIEGQSRRMNSDIPTIDINADSGPLEVRRLMTRLIAEQTDTVAGEAGHA
jgi:phenylpropionate dioxygenase-like ring-hydroxylating dioxygenase large terminal subunit